MYGNKHDAFAAVLPSKLVRDEDVALQRSILKKLLMLEGAFHYQLALTVQLQCANFLPHGKIVISGTKRGPLYTPRWHNLVADGAEIDDAHRPFRRVLCGRREKWKKQFGEIKVACKVNPSLRTGS